MGGELRVPPPLLLLELAYHSLAPAHAEVEGNSTHRRGTDKRMILNLDTLEEGISNIFPWNLQSLITIPSCEKWGKTPCYFSHSRRYVSVYAPRLCRRQVSLRNATRLCGTLRVSASLIDNDTSSGWRFNPREKDKVSDSVGIFSKIFRIFEKG